VAILALIGCGFVPGSSAIEVDLRSFEILHLKLLKVFSEAGVSVKYLGATGLTTEDRLREFLKAGGSGIWVVRRTPIDGIDPSSELGRVYLLERAIEGSQVIKVGNKNLQLALYDARGVCVDRPMGELAISPAKLAMRLSEMDDESFAGWERPTP